MKRFFLIALGCVSLVFSPNLLADNSSVDEDEPVGVEELADNDPAKIGEIIEALQLVPPIDIAEAFDDGTLVAKAKAIAPLSVEERLESDGAQLELDPKSFAGTATIWKPDSSSAIVSPSGKLNISVCWLNPSPQNERGRNLTKQAVKATWEWHGNVRFTNWNKCTDASRGIKIQIGDARPTSKVGNDSDDANPSMKLNFVFENDSMSKTRCKEKVDLCIYSIAVHEFGHALGFLHEQDAPNTPPKCKEKVGSATPSFFYDARVITNWDAFSVMNYCHPLYAARAQLSDCDIAAYRALYPGTIDPTNQFTAKCKIKAQ